VCGTYAGREVISHEIGEESVGGGSAGAEG